MKDKVKDAIEEYQCSGCVNGSSIKCFKSAVSGEGCGYHHAGTTFIAGSTMIKMFLGMPKGFNRLGHLKEMKPVIFDTFSDLDWDYEKWNVPVWKYLNKAGHTLVRGLSPRNNYPFIHIFLEDCLGKINCMEITQNDVDGMD